MPTWLVMASDPSGSGLQAIPLAVGTSDHAQDLHAAGLFESLIVLAWSLLLVLLFCSALLAFLLCASVTGCAGAPC
jgi:hypothetical protein